MSEGPIPLPLTALPRLLQEEKFRSFHPQTRCFSRDPQQIHTLSLRSVRLYVTRCAVERGLKITARSRWNYRSQRGRSITAFTDMVWCSRKGNWFRSSPSSPKKTPLKNMFRCLWLLTNKRPGLSRAQKAAIVMINLNHTTIWNKTTRCNTMLHESLALEGIKLQITDKEAFKDIRTHLHE